MPYSASNSAMYFFTTCWMFDIRVETIVFPLVGSTIVLCRWSSHPDNRNIFICSARHLCSISFDPLARQGASGSDHIARKCFQRIIPGRNLLQARHPEHTAIRSVLVYSFSESVFPYSPQMLFFQRNALLDTDNDYRMLPDQ